jgi:hypothetical protein
MHCYVCRKAGPDILMEKSLNVQVLFIIIKLKVWNCQHENCFNVVSEKPIPQLSIFCLIQGINNYVQINTYWRYILRIMASNILLLASKKIVLTSQGLVGAGMNCRALCTQLSTVRELRCGNNEILFLSPDKLSEKLLLCTNPSCS